ncbi:MAG: metallophosphoesterase [Polyangiaceae bacterium]
MIPLLPASISLCVCAGVAAAGAVCTRIMLPDLARSRFARGFAIALGATILAAHAVWHFAPLRFAHHGVTVASILLCLMPLVVLSIPIAAMLRRTLRGSATGNKISRRAFVAAAPGAAMSTGLSGFIAAERPPDVPLISFRWADLAPSLHGLQILQLSDLHLGVERRVEDLEALLDSLPAPPDLVVFTGDIADDPRLVEPALTAAVRFGPQLGVYACLGNHEYFYDVRRAYSAFARVRDARLLVSEGELVHAGGAKLWIAGANDPVDNRHDPTPFLTRSIDRALRGAPPDAFKLLLCHRPEGFVPAHERGVELTLAGHTHGGQIGFNGRSAFERIWPERYLWGRYSRGRSQLYTTSGFGHWFPFRILCPTEAPLVRLVVR